MPNVLSKLGADVLSVVVASVAVASVAVGVTVASVAVSVGSVVGATVVDMGFLSECELCGGAPVGSVELLPLPLGRVGGVYRVANVGGLVIGTGGTLVIVTVGAAAARVLRELF